MDFFGFPSASAGSASSIWPEEVLKEFPIPGKCSIDVSRSGVPDADIVLELPTLKSLITSVQVTMENPTVRHASMGVATAVFFCGLWKLKKYRWPSETSKNIKHKETPERTEKTSDYIMDLKVSPPNIGDHCDVPTKCLEDLSHWTQHESTLALGGDHPDKQTVKNSLIGFQQQLQAVLGQLEHARVQLNELEVDKNLLAAELEVRQKALLSVQTENKRERDLRQQAEMKMDLMEYENTQLKKMRRELIAKSVRLERIAKCVRDKEEYQEKLFQENVVLPRSVAQARAKEFTDMQARLQVLEARLVGVRRPCSRSMSIRSLSSISSLDERLDVSPSDHSLFKIRRLMKTSENSVIRSCNSSPLVFAPSSQLYTPVVVVHKKETSPRKSEAAQNGDKPERVPVLEDGTNVKEKRQATPLDHDIPAGGNSGSNAANSKKGIMSKIKAFVKGHSDTSLDSHATTKASATSLQQQKSPPVKTDPASAGQTKEVPNAPTPTKKTNGAVCESSSVVSHSEGRSPEVFQSFVNSSNVVIKSQESPVRCGHGDDNEAAISHPVTTGLTETSDIPTRVSSKVAKSLQLYKSAKRRIEKLKPQTESGSLQVHYQPKQKDGCETRPSSQTKQEEDSESDDSWCVIVPK